MGLLQAAYRTYEAQSRKVGMEDAALREPLIPVSHMIQNAQIEITLSEDGVFQSARTVPKEEKKTIIPVTVKSANRTSGPCPHPLCDQLCYLAPYGGEQHDEYCAQLAEWAGSDFSHPKVCAAQRYIAGGCILSDLAAVGVIALNEDGMPAGGKIEATDYGKCLVRWRVLSSEEEDCADCWRDSSLFQSFIDFYAAKCANLDRDLCLISGEQDIVCETHPKGTLSASFGAKLISANDSSGYTYRGRFTQARQAGNVGYTASQKAHNALRWVAANYGVSMGGRMFLCWNPEGGPALAFALFGTVATPQFTNYRQELLDTLSGYRQGLNPDAQVVIAALDAATTGRLSATYYNELRGSDFLDRVERWYENCSWNTRFCDEWIPSLKKIVTCAFGTERGQFIEVDERILREHVQQLLHCVVDRQPIPQDIIRALVVRAGTPLAYSSKNNNREDVLNTTCAVVRKYRNDRAKKEEWKLALDTFNRDRSYLFGRLLALAEQAERSTYGSEEGREPNAIRMQAVFTQRPLYAWRILHEQLAPYFARMAPGLRVYFKNLIGEITDQLDFGDPELSKKLEDTYLLGYYHQRTALFHKKETTVTEGNEHEPTEK